MDTTFQNQLNHREIITGVLLYFFRKNWLLIALCMGLSLLLFLWMGNVLFGVLLFIAIPIIFGAASVLMMLGQLSPKKVATYHLKEQKLEIESSSGRTSYFPYSQLKAYYYGNVIVFRLPHRQFVILAKRNMQEDQIAFLRAKLHHEKI